MSVNSGLKATKIIGQRKALYRQRIPPEFSHARAKNGRTYANMYTNKSKYRKAPTDNF